MKNTHTMDKFCPLRRLKPVTDFSGGILPQGVPQALPCL
nr:MAG TPA: hypothetical protein [Caudoviricetes sp.]